VDCIVTAGGLPGPEDSLYPYTQGKPKALLDMGERTMLERVMDALQTSNHVDRIVLVGLEDDMGMNFKRPIDQYLPDHGSLVNRGECGQLHRKVRAIRQGDLLYICDQRDNGSTFP
jgi:hypothetical protein